MDVRESRRGPGPDQEEKLLMPTCQRPLHKHVVQFPSNGKNYQAESYALSLEIVRQAELVDV